MTARAKEQQQIGTLEGWGFFKLQVKRDIGLWLVHSKSVC